MNASPQSVASEEVDGEQGYRCPICVVQTTNDQADTGWVRCPMIAGAYVCLGCCIDHQRVARSSDPSKHFDRELLLAMVVRTGNTLLELRRICTGHQLENIEEELELAVEVGYTAELQVLKREILALCL